MSAKNRCWSRRDFLRTVGITSASSLLVPAVNLAEAADKTLQVPQRPFGKTGANVSSLSLGGMFNIASNQMLMKQAMKWGVTYWDTADCYQRGSENGRKVFTKRIYRRSGQTHGSLAKPKYLQYLLADAEHDHSDVKRRRRHGQNATILQ